MMVSNNQQFNGLPMPVFTAFGWTGEEAALNYALTQLELFVQALHANLPRDLHNQFPYVGLDRESQTAYMAANEQLDQDITIVFYARPLSLQMMLTIGDQNSLNTALKAMAKDPGAWYRMLSDLGPDWSLRVQQMELNPETGERTHYKDLFKDDITNLTEDQAEEIVSTANYLNGEEKWVTPIYISLRIAAEQVAVMGRGVIEVTVDHLRALSPVLNLMTGQTRRKARAKTTRAAAEPGRVITAEADELEGPEPQDQFTYVAELMPLHIRRGFVNLTAEHWPFFAVNARMTVRPVTIRYNGRSDKKSSVWRLVPNDMARIVLSDKVQEWLEDNFDPNDKVQVRAVKLENDDIEVSLSPV